MKLQGAPWRPQESLAGARDTFWVPKGACAPAYVELWLAPLGAYRLLGLPMDTLSGHVVELTDVLGAGPPGWPGTPRAPAIGQA